MQVIRNISDFSEVCFKGEKRGKSEGFQSVTLWPFKESQFPCSAESLVWQTYQFSE
jgi:hypothetical protein